MPRFFERVDSLAEWWSDRFNPVVVKETRQAIKSQAFAISFMAMLALCLLQSIWLIVHHGEALQNRELGREFLPWYYFSLLVALCLVVPLGLFRSVQSEYDGHTFEMLAITSLRSSQIVFGKIKSASIQMGAFYCAAAPFVLYTYMLQGLSILAIVGVLLIAYFAGLSACLGAMMMGSLAKQSAWQVLWLFGTIVAGLICISIGFGMGQLVITEVLSPGEFYASCGGMGCFLYTFIFYALLTIGVSMSQFEPTLPRPGSPELRRRPTKSKLVQSPSNQPAATPDEPVGSDPTALNPAISPNDPPAESSAPAPSNHKSSPNDSA